VRHLVEELPEELARPSLVRPRREIPGVTVRENCLVPWSCEGESGVLMLRGVTPPSPPNLADAIALIAAPVWPRLLGGPAARVESSVAELRRLAERLRDDADRQVERLQAARPPVVSEPPAAEPVDAGRLAEVEQQLAGAREEVNRLDALVGTLRSEAAGVGTRLLEEQRAAVDARAEARAAEEGLADARQEVDRLNARLEELRSEKAAAARQQEEGRTAEDAKAEEARAAARVAEEGLATARKELGEAEASMGRLIVEREELRQQVTTLEKALGEVEEERDGFHREATRLESRLHALGVARPAGADGAATGPAAEPSPWSSESVEALRRALAVMRRTPFLPPPLRVAAQEAEAVAGAGEKREERWARVVILDREPPALEPLAGQLESAGLDVKIASHPEELALLLKTPDGRELDAAICDVLAFRPDQNVAGLFRGWQKDRPGLALYLSFSHDSPPEVDRAQRVPLSLTKGRFQRPLNWTELMEMLEPLRRPTA
jgi:hypothetical protein